MRGTPGAHAVAVMVGAMLGDCVLVGEEPNDGVGVTVIEGDWEGVTELVGDALGGVHADCILEEIALTVPYSDSVT